MPGFLKLLLSGKLVSVCVCLSVSVYVRPQVIKNHSHQMKPELPIKQILLLFSFFVWHLLSIIFDIINALVMKRVMIELLPKKSKVMLYLLFITR